MKHFSTTSFLNYARRGALLLALGAAGPVAWGQSFGPVTAYASGARPYGVALGDLNGDRRPDLVTVNAGDFSVSVLLGTGAGTFGTRTDFSTGFHPLSVVLGDVNGDGRLDVLTANDSGNSISVMLGTGTGTLGVQTEFPTSTRPCNLTLGDVNGDGHLDVLTTSLTVNPVSVLLGTGTGTFGSKTDFSAGSIFSKVSLGDVNGDGHLDVVIPDGTMASVLLGTGTGTFGTKTNFLTGSGSSSLTLGDVNSDGHLDIVAANGTSTAGVVSVLLGTGTGSFGAKTEFVTGAGPIEVALGDVNGDGHIDLVTSNSGVNTNTVSVLLGTGTGTFGAKTDFPAGTTPRNIVLSDVNGDGRLDLFVTNFSANTVSVLLNTGTFTPLATARPAAAEVALYPNPAQGSFTVQLPAGLAPGPAELLNSLGQVVRRPAAAVSRFTVETAGLAPGIYTLRVALGAAGTVARRVVVE